MLALAAELQNGWVQANTDGLIGNQILFKTESKRIERASNYLAVGNVTWAIAELEVFEKRITKAGDDDIIPQAREAMLAFSIQLRTKLMSQ